jgi:hypothetical protein
MFVCHAGNFAQRSWTVLGSPGVDLARTARRIIPTVTIGHRCAQNLSAEERTSRKFENITISDRGISRISKSITIYGIAKDFKDLSLFRNNCYRIALIGIDPDIFLAIKRYTVAALENRMSDKDIAEAQRVSGKCLVASGRTFKISLSIEFDLPKRSPSGIYIEEIALLIER